MQSDQLSPIGADMTSASSLSLSTYTAYYFMISPFNWYPILQKDTNRLSPSTHAFKRLHQFLISDQAHGDLVSAVDFGEEFLVAGFEDASLGVWELMPIKKVNFYLIADLPFCGSWRGGGKGSSAGYTYLPHCWRQYL